MPIKLKIAAILIACGIATAQSPYQAPPLLPGTVASSPGKSVDKQAWESFIAVVTPLKGRATFESWPSDHKIYGPPPAGYAPGPERPPGQRFTGKGFGSVRALLHGANPGGTLEIPQLPVPCAQIKGEGTTPSATNNPGNFPVGCVAEEVRRDPRSTIYIVEHHLNTAAGLAENFAKSEPVVFPEGSLQIKADWVPVNDLIAWLTQNGKLVSLPEVMDHYYTATDLGITYALVSMHVSKKTKELPNWLWMTFEHQWNPGRCDTSGCYDEYGAGTASVSTHVLANTQYPDCVKSKDLAAQFAAAHLPPVWDNYCLKGSQIDFTSKADGTGSPTILGDSMVERILVDVPIQSSSCISCHATAGFTALPAPYTAGINPRVNDNVLGPYKLPSNYKGYDFMWGLINIPGPQIPQPPPPPQFGP